MIANTDAALQFLRTAYESAWGHVTEVRRFRR